MKLTPLPAASIQSRAVSLPVCPPNLPRAPADRFDQAKTWALGILVAIAVCGCGQPTEPADDASKSEATSPATNSSGTQSGGQPTAVEVPTAGPVFRDVTESSGIDFTYRNGEQSDHYAILESVGGGVALLDFDHDGRLDIFFAGGGSIGDEQLQGHGCRLYRGLGNLRFEDISQNVQLPDTGFYSHGCFAADYNGDSWTDMLMTGYGRLALYENQEGRRFVDVTSAVGLDAPKDDIHWSTAAAWGDLNSDGRLDLFVGHYLDWSLQNNPPCTGNGPQVPRDVCSPNRFQRLAPQLFLAQPDGTFRETARQSGLLPGKVLGAIICDANEDQIPDLYVTNDAYHNQLYINDGQAHFEEMGALAGVAYGELGEAEGSMGVAAIDLRGNGKFSLFVTNFQGEQHAFYEYRSRGVFEHSSHNLGLAAIGRNYVGWANEFFDYDLDGDQDLLITNGHVMRHVLAPESLAQRTLLLENRGPDSSRLFVPVDGGDDYFQQLHRGRGAAVGDLNNDGRLDVVISHINQPAVVLANDLDASHPWVGLELIGRMPLDPISARVTLQTPTRTMVRQIRASGGYLSSRDRRIVFGLADEPITQLKVEWPSGTAQVWKNLPSTLNRYLQITENDETIR